MRGGCPGSAVPAPGARAGPLTAGQDAVRRELRVGHAADWKRFRRLHLLAWARKRGCSSGRPARRTLVFRSLRIGLRLDRPR